MSITPPLVETLKDHTSDFLRQNGFAQCMEESGYQKLRAHRPMLMAMPWLRFDFLPPEEEVEELLLLLLFLLLLLDRRRRNRATNLHRLAARSRDLVRASAQLAFQGGSGASTPVRLRIQSNNVNAVLGVLLLAAVLQCLCGELGLRPTFGLVLGVLRHFCHSWCWRHHKFSHWC